VTIGPGMRGCGFSVRWRNCGGCGVAPFVCPCRPGSVGSAGSSDGAKSHLDDGATVHYISKIGNLAWSRGSRQNVRVLATIRCMRLLGR
jgi:hypothetical protein